MKMKMLGSPYCTGSPYGSPMMHFKLLRSLTLTFVRPMLASWLQTQCCILIIDLKVAVQPCSDIGCEFRAPGRQHGTVLLQVT